VGSASALHRFSRAGAGADADAEYDVDSAWHGTGLGSGARSGAGGSAWLDELAERAGREAARAAMQQAREWAPE